MTVLFVVLDIIILYIKRYLDTIIHCLIPKIVILTFLTLIGGMPHFDPKFQKKIEKISLHLRPDNYSFRERKN